MTNQLNIFVAVLFAVAVSSAYNVENKITCEWQPMQLECNNSEVLKIMSANYGRTNASVCQPFENTNCRAPGSLSIIKNKCDGQTSCTVMATNYVFGDPCHGVVKYIEAQYQCVPAPAYTANQFRCDDGKCKSESLLCNGYPDCSEEEDERECNVETKITCEWQPMQLECNSSEVLKIMSANYGRTNASVCEPFENTNCRAPGSLSIIKNKCDGQTSCTVMATNYVFGDPCHGVVKYIEAQYQCVPAPACTANQFRCDDGKCISKSLLCNGHPDCSGGEDERECIDVENKITYEWQPMKLKCNRGEVLKIMSVNHGRTSATLCELFENTNSRASGSLSIIRNICDGQTSCTVMATNYVFADPCNGVVKYIEAQYQCVPDVENKITCESQPMKLECNRGEVLKIMSANYGRTNANLCEPNANTNCRASGSLSIIKNKCEGQTSCTVMATNDVFGDPCRGVVKYIEAQYQCVPAPACTTDQFRCDDGKCMSKSLLCNGYPDCSRGEDERGCNYRTAYACEGDTLNVECARGEVIRFISGNYGRTNYALCEINHNTNCRSSVASTILKDKCDLRRGCSVPSTNEVFGDPCHGVKKYIELNYYCYQIAL